MIHYKIIEATPSQFKGIEMELDFSENKLGDQISVLGLLMSITQLGTEIVACSSPNNILVFQKTSKD